MRQSALIQTGRKSLPDLTRVKRQNVKVLIADDSAMVRSRLRHLLEDIRGVTIDGEAQDASQALDRMEAHTPDVLILDIQMPGGSGFNVLQRSKSDHPETVVIILTNYPYLQYKKKYLNAGADYFFDKSTEFENLIEVIRQMNEARPFHSNN